MLDTIVLVLKQSEFSILDHTRFSPSTEGLFNAQYRLGGRSNMFCKQNPTTMELKNGIYKPRLTVTKRINKLKNFEITLKIELSLPKLLFGNNFDELVNEDFFDLVVLLENKLSSMGVRVIESNLATASVSAIHFSKNIPLTDYSVPYRYLKELSKVNVNQQLDLNQTDFRNEGHSLKYRANSFEVVFYDKLKDLEKSEISEKRAEEVDNQLQQNLFNGKITNKPFEVLRMEVRLNKKQKFLQILDKIGIKQNPTFCSVFNQNMSQKILSYYLDEIEKRYPPILLLNCVDENSFLVDFKLQNPHATLKKALQMLSLRTLIDKYGAREFREITKIYGRSNWYSVHKEMGSLNRPQKALDVFGDLHKALDEFKPLKLVDFQYQMINNDKYN